MPLMSLGLFAFSVSTLAFDELQRKASWRHASAPRVGTVSATQYLGPGEETVSLSGTAYAELGDGRASLDELWEMAHSGEAWPLVDGTGRVWGAFHIKDISEGAKHFHPDGTARRIDFQVELGRVDDPREAGQAPATPRALTPFNLFEDLPSLPVIR